MQGLFTLYLQNLQHMHNFPSPSVLYLLILVQISATLGHMRLDQQNLDQSWNWCPRVLITDYRGKLRFDNHRLKQKFTEDDARRLKTLVYIYAPLLNLRCRRKSGGDWVRKLRVFLFYFISFPVMFSSGFFFEIFWKCRITKLIGFIIWGNLVLFVGLRN